MEIEDENIEEGLNNYESKSSSYDGSSSFESDISSDELLDDDDPESTIHKYF